MNARETACHTERNHQTRSPALVALKRWEEGIGVTSTTTWRWRRAGWIKTINIQGRVYVSEEAIAEFRRRAEAGDFSKVHKAPEKK